MSQDEQSTPCAICAQGVSFGYSSRDLVLEEVSFSIRQGATVACIGPNGGGKSTLLRLLLGFLTPNQGTLQILGVSPCAARPWIAYVPQAQHHDKLFPISAEEVVLMGLLRELGWTGRFTKAQRERAQKALADVGLEPLSRISFGNLSGGQAQRVLIARALVSQPQLLLLDEPTASVDPGAEAQIYELLQRMKGERTILLVTHDLHTAHRHVDSVLCVQRRVSQMRPEQLCEHFSLGLYHRLRPLPRREACHD